METAGHYFKKCRVFYILIILVMAWQVIPAMADDHRKSDYPALGEAEYKGLCKYRGHIGKIRCTRVKAKSHNRYSCKGKNVLFSKVNGVKGCYSCPDGYTRFSPSRKMDHKKACTKRQPGKNAYKKATKLGTIGRCGDGKFKHKGYCKSCPAKTKRMNVAGLDNGYCKVKKEYHCNKGLKLHKSQPQSGWDKAGNLVVPKYKKICGMPFNLKQYGKDILGSDKNKEALEALKDLGKALTSGKRTTKDKMKDYKKAVKEDRLQDAYEILISFEEFETLKNVLTETKSSSTAVGGAAQNFTITTGYVVDASVVGGYNYEWGYAIDFKDKKLKKYKSHGISKGLSFGGDAGFTLGIWKGAFKTSYSQGYVGAVALGTFGASAGVWSDYYRPKRSDGKNQPHFVGLSIAVGAGAGAEVGEYNEVYTKVTSETSM